MSMRAMTQHQKNPIDASVFPATHASPSEGAPRAHPTRLSRARPHVRVTGLYLVLDRGIFSLNGETDIFGNP